MWLVGITKTITIHNTKDSMQATETKLKGCFILEPKKFGDSRGYFFESFNEQKFNDVTQAQTRFVQDNQSYSTNNVHNVTM